MRRTASGQPKGSDSPTAPLYREIRAFGLEVASRA